MEHSLHELTTQIVVQYLRGNKVVSGDLPDIITAVHQALVTLGQEPEPMPGLSPPSPAVPIKKSVRPEHIVCLECGQKMKMLRRHLQVNHGIEPDQYRKRWSLPESYPLTAPDYTEIRSKLARDLGLGTVFRATGGTKDTGQNR